MIHDFKIERVGTHQKVHQGAHAVVRYVTCNEAPSLPKRGLGKVESVTTPCHLGDTLKLMKSGRRHGDRQSANRASVTIVQAGGHGGASLGHANPLSVSCLAVSSFLVCVLAMSVAGCYTPVGTDRPSSSRSGVSSNRAKVEAGAPASLATNGSDGAVSVLKVNSDRLEAAKLWNGHRKELAEKASELTRDGYQSYVAHRAADLVRDSVAELLLYQTAKLRMTPEIEKRLEELITEDIRRIETTEFGGSQRRYERELREQGQTMEDAREKLRREAVIRSYLEQEVRPKIAEPTRAELFDAYQQLLEESKKPKRRRMSLIDVRIDRHLPEGVSKPTDEQWKTAAEQARTRIEKAYSMVQSGTPFAEVAKQMSDGLHAVDGGAWGWITKESVRQRFEPAVAALYQLDKGQTSSILEVKGGFFIVRCDDVEGAEVPDFESFQPQLVERHFEKSYREAISKLVEDLRGKARIVPPDLGRFHAGVVAAAPPYNALAGPNP